MEIKAILNKPYTEKQRMDFIVHNNHQLGYEIKETETELQAWGKTTEEEQEEIKQKESERIAGLHMTRADMFEALILAKGITKTQIRAIIEQAETLNETERLLYLNRFDEALEFYRNHPAINFIGNILNITSEQLDRFFETKDWNCLNC